MFRTGLILRQRNHPVTITFSSKSVSATLSATVVEFIQMSYSFRGNVLMVDHFHMTMTIKNVLMSTTVFP